MQGKQWKELQSRLAVAQTNKDRSAEVAGVLPRKLPAACSRTAITISRAPGGAAEVAGA